jgi:hypothetical protein
MIHITPRQTEVWRCTKCRSVFSDGLFYDTYLVCPACDKLCSSSCSIGEWSEYRHSIGDRQIPFGIAPSENDFLNAIKSNNINANHAIIRVSEFGYPEFGCQWRDTLAVLRLHAFREGRNNELQGKHTELRTKRIDNARMLVLAIEPCDFLFEIFDLLGEYEKSISYYRSIPLSRRNRRNFEKYSSAIKRIDPDVDIEEEREALIKDKELLQISWEKALASTEASTKFEAVSERFLMYASIVSFCFTIYLLFKEWLYALVFGFVVFKVIGFFDSRISSRKYDRLRIWKKDHPKPIDF